MSFVYRPNGRYCHQIYLSKFAGVLYANGMSDENGSFAGEGKVAPNRYPLLALHAAIDAESVWQAGVELLRAQMPAYHYLMALPTERMKPFLLRTTLPVPNEKDYWERMNKVAPLEGLLKRMAGQKVARMSDLVPFVIMRFSPFYRNFMKPEGWRFSAAMFFWDGERYLGQFAQNRTAEQGDFTDQEMQVIADLHGQFEVAIRRVMLLDRERSSRAAVEESIRRSPLPTAVLDWDLNPVYHNSAAVEASVVWAVGPERARALKPVFTLPDDVRESCLQLRQTASGWDTHTAGSHLERLLHHPNGNGSQALLRIIGPASGMTRPCLLVEFRMALKPGDATDPTVLLSRLTQAEREVAVRVGRGLDNDTIATELGVSCSTVRTHLRSIFSKLTIYNRTQLAVLVRG